ASLLLSASLDYEQTLVTVARLVVQNVADWCGVDLLDEYGHLRRVKVVTSDPGKAALSAVLERMPPDRTRPDPVSAHEQTARRRAGDAAVDRVDCPGTGTSPGPSGDGPHLGHGGAALDA